MKVSVAITLLNEEGSISALLDSLLAQKKKPDEIILVDGGSKDKTAEIIRHYQKKDKRIKLLVEPGTVAHGRNTSIDLSKNEVIASTDAGCTAAPDWLEKITAPFRHEGVGMVAGFYTMPTDSALQQAMSVYHGVPPERFNPENFIPSARSVAFSKDVWQEVGGYDEKLHKAGEDTLFFYKVAKTGTRIVRVKDALVYWNEAATFTLKDSLRKFYQYAKGDAQAGIWWHPQKRLATHNIKTSSIFIRYLLGFSLLLLSFVNNSLFVYLLICLFAYFCWSIFKWRDVIKDWNARVWLPVVQVLSDFAVMAGFVSGVVTKKN